MFENFIKKRENAAAKREDMEQAEKEGRDYVELNDEHYKEFYAAVQSWEEQDAASAEGDME